MRSLVVLFLAATGFVAFGVRVHQRADRTMEAEAKVPARIRLEGKRGVQTDLPPRDGYVYEWIEGENQEPILTARPIQPGRTGARWFVTLDGIEVYEFDTTLFQADDDGPATVPIRRFLEQPLKKREGSSAPTGWKPVP